jgi:5'-deoxynucleotidase YfbR-like HD superfamily hydrolase
VRNDKDFFETVVEIMSYADTLSNIVRYSMHEKLREQNVAEHSFRVALLAMAIADAYCDNGAQVNYEVLLKRALMHDMEEAINGDISYVVKNRNSSTKDFFNKLESETIENSMFQKNNIYKCIIQNARTNDLEGRIVSIADMLEILFYAMREMRMGNKQMQSLYDRVLQYVNSIAGEEFKFVYELASRLNTCKLMTENMK